jgi:hypothetical protein
MHYGVEVYYSMCDELEKLARGRLERELAAGNLGEAELARLPASALLVNDPTVGEEHLMDLRDSLWMPGETDLTPEQLARRRRLNRLIGRKDLELLGGLPANLPGTGPGTARGTVFVDPSAGQLLRHIAKGSATPMEIKRNMSFGAPFESAPLP